MVAGGAQEAWLVRVVVATALSLELATTTEGCNGVVDVEKNLSVLRRCYWCSPGAGWSCGRKGRDKELLQRKEIERIGYAWLVVIVGVGVPPAPREMEGWLSCASF